MFVVIIEPDNVNVHRAAAKDMQAEKTARPAAPCATYCYHALWIHVECCPNLQHHEGLAYHSILITA